LGEEGFAEALNFGVYLGLAWLFDGELAVRRGVLKDQRILFGETEVDKIGRVIDFEIDPVRFRRRLERQGEMERQQRILVFGPVIGGVAKFRFLAVQLGEGEELELLERGSILGGERG
jgi:hypothetical protein